MSNLEIITAIQEMDAEVLDAEDLVTLASILPIDDELMIASEFQNRQLDLPLGPAEQWLVDLVSAPNLPNQHLAFLFSLQFSNELTRIALQIMKIDELTSELQSSPDLKVLLKTILELGNMTNYGSNNNSTVIGFKIDGLARLSEVKSADGKWTLMNFLVDTVEAQSPALLELADEFKELSTAKSCDIIQISREILAVDETFKSIRAINFDPDFTTRLDSYVFDAESQIDTCIEIFDGFVKNWLGCLAYFGEDSTTYALPSLQTLPDSEKKSPQFFFEQLDLFFTSYRQAVNIVRNKTMDPMYGARKWKQVQQQKGQNVTIVLDNIPKGLSNSIDPILDQEAQFEEARRMFNRLSMLPPLEPYSSFADIDADFEQDY